jgi:DNA polymerase phi
VRSYLQHTLQPFSAALLLSGPCCFHLQVLSQAPKLTALLQVQPASATPESLFIALRLWHNLPMQQLQSCQLLPSLPASAAPPPELFWQQPGSVQRSSVTAAAAALFAAGQLKVLCPALLATTASHPRLHPVWGCVLALLVPGFVPVKVGWWEWQCMTLNSTHPVLQEVVY